MKVRALISIEFKIFLMSPNDDLGSFIRIWHISKRVVLLFPGGLYDKRAVIEQTRKDTDLTYCSILDIPDTELGKLAVKYGPIQYLGNLIRGDNHHITFIKIGRNGSDYERQEYQETADQNRD